MPTDAVIYLLSEGAFFLSAISSRWIWAAGVQVAVQGCRCAGRCVYIFPSCASTLVAWFLLKVTLQQGSKAAASPSSRLPLCLAHAAQHYILCLIRGPFEQGETAGLLQAIGAVARVRFCLVAGSCCQVLRRLHDYDLALLNYISPSFRLD